MKPFRTRLAAFLGSSFFKGSFIYLSGSILNSALPLLVLPVLTRYLTPTDFGFVATATVLTQILSVFIGLNAYGLVARSYFDDDPDDLRNLLSTGMAISVAVASGFLLLVLLLGQPIARLTEFPAAWLPAVLLIAFATVVQNNYLSLIQVRSEPLRYISIQTLGGVLNLGLAVWFVVGWRMDWHGRMWALLAAQGVVALFCLRGLVFRLGLLRPRFRQTSYRQIMAFVVPLIPHFIGGWVMTMAARLYLNNMETLGATGLYSVAFNLTSPLALLLGAANNAYVPTLYQHLSSKAGCDKVRLCRILLAVAFSLPILAFLCAVAVRWVLPWIVGERFYGAADFVLWMALAFAMQGIYFIFGNFVVYSKKTSLMTWRADFLGGLVLVIACPLLIRLNGPLGAAQATFLAFAASTLGCITAAQRAYPMPWGTAFRSLFPADTGKKTDT